MSVRFFGQFLLENEIIDRRQLKDASDLMFWVNRRIGELAAKVGYMNLEDVDRIHRAQRNSDRHFGGLAVDAGLLTNEQIKELLAVQNARQLRLGEALVELGFLDHERLKQLLQRFDQEQAAFALDCRQIPEPLGAIPGVRFALEQVPRIAMRTALLPLKIGQDHKWEAKTSYEYRASITIRSEVSLEIGVAADKIFVTGLASANHAASDSPLDEEDLIGALTVFLKALASSVQSTLEGQGLSAELTLLRHGELPSTGRAYDLVSIQGEGLLILTAA